MRFSSILAIYTLFWTISLFVVLPFGVRTSDELGEAKVAGQADSAPANFRPLRVILATTLVSAAAFAIFVLNYNFGWVGLDQLNFFNPPE